MYYLRARYYDPDIMRFISEDTYRGDIKNPLSLNLYTYCKGNPIKYIDFSGNNPILIAGGIGVLAGSIGYLGSLVDVSIEKSDSKWYDIDFEISFDKQNFSWGELGINAGSGAVGGIAMLFTGVSGTIAINGSLGGITTALSSWYKGEEQDLSKIITSVIGGAAVGGVANKVKLSAVTNDIPNIGILTPIKDPTLIKTYNQEFMKKIGKTTTLQGIRSYVGSSTFSIIDDSINYYLQKIWDYKNIKSENTERLQKIIKY